MAIEIEIDDDWAGREILLAAWAALATYQRAQEQREGESAAAAPDS